MVNQLLMGLTIAPAQEVDTRLSDGVCDFLFGDAELNSPEITAVIELNNICLADIVRKNTTVSNMQTNVFIMVPKPADLALWTAELLPLILFRRAPV